MMDVMLALVVVVAFCGVLWAFCSAAYAKGHSEGYDLRASHESRELHRAKVELLEYKQRADEVRSRGRVVRTVAADQEVLGKTRSPARIRRATFPRK